MSQTAVMGSVEVSQLCALNVVSIAACRWAARQAAHCAHGLPVPSCGPARALNRLASSARRVEAGCYVVCAADVACLDLQMAR